MRRIGSCEARATSDGAEFHVLPGVREASDAVSNNPRYHSALLSGNFETTAWYKVNLAGLSDYFDVPGAFGDQSFERRELARLAAQRISAHLRMELQPSQFIVIGDTPDDIACARYFGARSVAVATGHMYGVEELLACKPDAILPDLSDTERFTSSRETMKGKDHMFGSSSHYLIHTDCEPTKRLHSLTQSTPRRLTAR